MSESPCSLLGCGQDDERRLEMEDYESGLPRWCSGCGDHAVLGAVERLLVSEQLPRERTVFVSGIGCSGRFPHYVNTYGFHGIHGRALPIATGVKLGRSDLNVFAVMGDGDCCSIGAGHWIHAIRYNVDMVALLLDNNVYGLTKNQTSPTTPQGWKTNTQPEGSYLPPLNPLSATLGVTNASFVAQSCDWVPGHLYQTLRAAQRHRGFSFVRVLQRCPVFTPAIFDSAARKPAETQLLVHERGVRDPEVESIYTNQVLHDPSDLGQARRLAEESGVVRIGLFYCDPSLPQYDKTRHVPHRTTDEKLALLESELDRYVA
ncbi:MAG: 2-oxoglutarate oxidoreductase [Planctomycetota bacterium]|nr:MAG: 2-oxoglutarate oxidoreductase [Planctomycetota bacterium]